VIFSRARSGRAGLTVEQVRPIRDEISARVRALISELGS